ncbi:hypothetical protein GOM96_11315 [Stutzerimonas degradans]|nr:hypothetical protein GOM96_11315 [Stutzerimonas degradans]
MKLIEPLSSALLVTGCVYAAGMAQNSAFMRVFGVNPAFSQPAIDKIFYDGGLITFELFVKHFIIASAVLIGLFCVSAVAAIIIAYKRSTSVRNAAVPVIDFAQSAVNVGGKASSFASLLYLTVLTFLAYEKAQEDGAAIADSFIKTCHEVVIKKGKDETSGCAFNKDRDSIWFFTIQDDTPVTNSKLLSELDQIIYLDPVTF